MSPIARVLKSEKKLPQIFILHLNVLQPKTLKSHRCYQNSTFFIHAKFQDVWSWPANEIYYL